MSKKLSVFLCRLLRHHPEIVGLDLDLHGWASVKQLINGVNEHGRFYLDQKLLENIVSEDEKGRYRLNKDHTQIKCCQGHTIPWVIPELTYRQPPQYLYHGTNTKSLQEIEKSGNILKMKRHAVHLQKDEKEAWKSAKRWKKDESKGIPVVLQIDASTMVQDGFEMGVTENNVWCTEYVPVKYICNKIYETP